MKQERTEGRKPEIQFLSVGGLPQWFGWIGVFLCYLAVGNAYADDYFDRITVASNGRLTRFDRDRITIYTDSIPFDAGDLRGSIESIAIAMGEENRRETAV